MTTDKLDLDGLRVAIRVLTPTMQEWITAVIDELERAAPQPAAAVPDGYVMVPNTPTDEMLAAMLSEGEYGLLTQHSFDLIGASAVLRLSCVGTRYANMLDAAAPKLHGKGESNG